MPSIGTCFRFYAQMRVEKKTKHLHIKFIVNSHNSVVDKVMIILMNGLKPTAQSAWFVM